MTKVRFDIADNERDDGFLSGLAQGSFHIPIQNLKNKKAQLFPAGLFASYADENGVP